MFKKKFAEICSDFIWKRLIILRFILGWCFAGQV